MKNFLSQYNYKLPPELIAKLPASPRDSARLLVWDKKTQAQTEDIFFHLDRYLPKNSLIVFNQTRVIPARIRAVKTTGGKVELLYLSHKGNRLTCLVNKSLTPNTILIFYGRKKQGHLLTLIKKQGNKYIFKTSVPGSQIPTLIRNYGITPLPPYMKNSPLPEKERRKWYQTIFAKKGLSIAAPTAGLHFTKRLLKKLKAKKIQPAFIRLDVGLGTFAPLTETQIYSRRLHEEFYHIDPKTHLLLKKAKQTGRPIIAVGTTVVRTLESAYKNPKKPKLSGNTNLFITPGFAFSMTGGLITNFHVPKSSLLMLVAAFVGEKRLFKLYKYAISKKFRFFSFGDAMLVKPDN